MPEKPDPWGSLWRTITRYDAAKIEPHIALRTAFGISLPLAAAVVLGNPAAGVIAATGALNVSFSDGSDPYSRRAGRMLTATALGSVAVVVGGLCGHSDVVTILITTAWAFAAGMMVALDNAAADIGLISLVTLVVFTARAMTVEEAAYSGLLAFSGGILQTSLALALWPVRRYEPEQRAIGDLFLELSRLAAGSFAATEAPPGSAQFTQAHQLLSGGWRSRSNQRLRYWSLLSQAERIRLSLLMIARLRARLAREAGTVHDTSVLDRARELSARILSDVGVALLAGGSATISPDSMSQFAQLTDAYRETRGGPDADNASALIQDARFQLDALAGQLRSAVDLAAYSTRVGREAFERREASAPWTLRLVGAAATLRANLSLNSSVCRHAIRLSICVGAGDAMARSVDWERSYWLPMTIAIVLKPDFTTTFSRGVLRLVGTFFGLAFATVLFHVVPLGPAVEVVFIGILAFVLRCFGPANYGLFVIAISALVVLLFALIGVTPKELVASRGINTLIGGIMALGAYALWPTWERSHVAEAIAHMLESYREYFRGIREAYTQPDAIHPQDLDRRRLAGRLARSNVEGSVERFRVEPHATAEAAALLSAILASSHRMVHAMMALEAGLARSHAMPARPEFHAFANHVETTLHSLAASLRGSRLTAADLPDLRAGHHALVQSGDQLTERYALVNVESDRITNSLNTLSAQLLEWKQ